MDQPPLTEQSSWKASAIPAFLVFVLSVVLGFVVRAPYFGGTFALDEVYFLEDIGLVRNGRLNFANYLLTLNGGYLHILAKLQFYVLWYCFGLNPDAHRIVIALAHAISATAMFLLVRHYLSMNQAYEMMGPAIDSSQGVPASGATLAGLVASLMWATVAVGGYDNVFLLIGSGEQAPCIMWLTLAMLCVTQCQTYPVWSSAGMVFCLACSSLTWGLGLALAPAVLVQFFLLESPSLRSSGLRWKWFLMWAGVVGLIALVHFVLRAVNQDPTSAGAMAWNMPWRFVVQFAAAFGNLVGFSHAQANSSIALKVTLATLLLAAAFFYGGNSRRVLCVFLAATVGYVAVLVVFRADRDLFDGRYLYVPSLLWCVVAGVVVGGVYRHRRALGRKLLVACVMLAGLLHVFHQRAIAGEARAQFDQYLTITEETLEGYKALLDQLEQQAQLCGNAVRLPDFPIVVPPNFYPTYFPFSAWVAVARNEPPIGVELLEPDELTPQEIESAATFLESLDLLQARQAAHALRTAVPDSRSLMWLSEFAQQHEIVILVPNFTFAYPELNLSYPVIQCLSNAFDQSLPGLRVVSVDDVPKAELSQQLELLETSPDREADTWISLLGRFVDSHPGKSPPDE